MKRINTTQNRLSGAIRHALVVSVVAGAAYAPAGFAQEDASALEEIVVTGSRIQRQDYTSNAPVATVGVEQIELTGTVNTESLLNTLPQTVPGLDRTSNNPGNGTATVDLRGLGSNRTLVLIDGKRVTPTTSGGTVDINGIPNALIENIEVLTGGASAVYGSDAVAGVVNFIMKRDFEGVALNGGYELTEDGDAGITSGDITLGGNIADGRGNIVFNIAYTERDDLFQADRDFSFFAQFDTDTNGDNVSDGLINGGSSGIPSTSIFSGGLGAFFPSFGATFTQGGDIRGFDTDGDDNDFYNYAPENYIQLPQTRYQASAIGHFQVNDSAEVYGRAMYTNSQVPQQLAPTPIFQTATFTLDGNPFLTENAQQVLTAAHGDGVDTDGDGIDDTGTAFLRRRMEEVGPRIADSDFNSFQLQAGVRGDIGASTWSYDAFAQQGIVTATETQRGNIDRQRFQQALLVNPDGSCTNPAAGSSTVPCSGLNIWGEGNISDAAAAFVSTAVSSTADYEQTMYGINFTGNLGNLELPGGAIAAAVGYEFIDNEFDFRPSQDLASGNIAGFNGAPAVTGAFDVSSVYAEAYLPILSGAQFAEILDVELAYRASDYSTVGSVDSYKIGASWAPNDQVRFRAGFNTAVRAPSVGELFAPVSEGFPGATDPCAAEGAPDSATSAICAATGVPANVIGTPAINLAAGQVRALGGGNPNLQEEEAETLTVGIVVSPAAVEGLTVSLDYFDIEIEEYIAAFGGGANNVLSTCYDPNDAAGGAGSDFCNAVVRRPDGTIDFVLTASQNVAKQTLTGYDLLASYDFQAFGGDMRINYVGTFTEENDFTPFTGADPITCAGEFGADCGEPIPEYSHRTSFNWSRDNWTTQLLWRHIGSVDDDDEGFVYAVDSIGSEDYFDASVSYDFSDNYGLTFGIDNLLDTDPPIIGDNQEQANTYPATYDVFGRTFFVRGSARF